MRTWWHPGDETGNEVLGLGVSVFARMISKLRRFFSPYINILVMLLFEERFCDGLVLSELVKPLLRGKMFTIIKFEPFEPGDSV